MEHTSAVPQAVENSNAGSQFVQSLARGLDVIRAFDAEHPSMTLTDVAKLTGLSRATARRFLLTLADLGYVQTDGKHFELTSRVLQLGYSYLSSHTLPQLIDPVLQGLSARMRESSSASVLDGADVVYISRVHARSIMRVGISVGSRFPAYATSMGRVLLAHLPAADLEARLAGRELSALTPNTITDPAELRAELTRVRAQGYCLVDQELEIGLRSIAAPVFAPDGSVAAALNISMSTLPNGTGHDVDEAAALVLPELLAAAEQVRAALAARR
ncbi:IclR family transcriptional regulator domain-containing protein [Paeniglutamicibacter cryotolerans]|uniref:Glycerol operon regulatory protein n=1 Tax=Paeniglutamicibacter cryotolerans TaxID=670079 RepID=A0A839QE12_9MICC|nr:IclR family transcriptional regulator C-terminal domain-containing protein [Paeniglutamicibacter cryotolerans]MBB2994478.1 IclR family pca regulon transcriptional regulator [Paeniglutamicibacter cryotolerans]